MKSTEIYRTSKGTLSRTDYFRLPHEFKLTQNGHSVADELRMRVQKLAAELLRTSTQLRRQIAKRKRAEKALKGSEKKSQLLMDHINEAVSIIRVLQKGPRMEAATKVMITGLAHDLRNPLAVISSCTQFCLETMDLTPPMKEKLLMIRENCKRANDLVKQCLDFAKSDALEYRPVNVNEVVIRAWEMAKLDVMPHAVSLEAQLEPTLPEITGCPEKLERVFLNLFLNALQAISKKGKVVVQTRFLPSQNLVEVKIIDDGPGIPKKNRQRIFDPFFTTKEEGTGLGLHICQFFVQQHKGSIAVECEGECGTTVSVRLPVIPDALGVNIAETALLG